jgi:hypothetical protein
MGPTKLEFYITQGLKGLPDTYPGIFGPFINYKENEMLWIWLQVLYSQILIIFATYEWTH